MNDFDTFEQRLAAAVRRDADRNLGPFEAGTVANAAIASTRARAAHLPRASSRPTGRIGRGRGIALLAATALVLVGGALAAGWGFLRMPSIVPPVPAPSLGVVATPSPRPTASAVTRRDDDRPAANGWIAFARSGSGPRGPNGWVERDIYFLREGGTAHRIVGSDADSLDQICPALSPDGRRLAHGEAEGTADTEYHDAALVISDLDTAGNASESLRIDIGGSYPPPCAVWSADGRRVAFTVGLTSPGNDRSAAGNEVWIATVADGHVDVLSNQSATDLEWSPDGSQLAIASGQSDLVDEQSPRDGSIRLYDADRGDMRTLVGPGPWGVWKLTWAPDGSRIAYQRGRSDGYSWDQEIWVVQVDGSGEDLIARGFGSIYGVGPVWSPTGDRIVYQRMKGGGEAHDVVLVKPDGGSEVVLPDVRLPGDDASVSWRPDSVTWSPDGKELLYSAWISGRPGSALISRPLDPRSDPVVLQENLERAGENRSWGRLPDGSPTLAPTPTAKPSSAADEVLNGFLEARVAGEGAQRYLAVPQEEIPLL